MAGEHIVKVALVESVHRKGEIVHESELVVARPNAVQAVDQCVQRDDRDAHVAIRDFVQQIVKVPVEILVEGALRHFRHKAGRSAGAGHRSESLELGLQHLGGGLR